MTFTDPGLEIHQAVLAALKVAPAVAALVGNADGTLRIYDRVPRLPNGDPNAEFPYITLGELQIIPELAEATDAAESAFTLHVWSRRAGSVEAKQLASAVAGTLHDADIGGIQSILLKQTRIMGDPDGLTTHGILVFEILTDANS